MADISVILGVIVGVSLTLMCFSQLFKHTILYRIASTSAVSATVANIAVAAVNQILTKGLTIQYILPTIAGVLYFSVYSERYRWLSRYPIAIMIGVGTGITIRTAVQAQILNQIIDTIQSVDLSNAYVAFSSLVLVIGVITTIVYFIFTNKLRGRMLILVKIGQIFLYIAIGVVFASAMLADFSLANNRIKYLIDAFTGKLFI